MIINILIYVMFYIIGVVLGSFFTLAIYRIPLKQDITHTRSYCPKCNHRLEFLDLIPILSYIFLKGKCRYCHNKISKRYIIIEALSGLLYLLFVVSLKINFLEITYTNISSLFYGTFMISVLFILGGIAKESKMFSTSVFTFGVIVQIIYIVYLCILQANIYRYIIYILSVVLLLIIRYYIKSNKSKEYLNIMLILLFSFIAANKIVGIVNILFFAILLVIKKLFKKNIGCDLVFYISFITIFASIIFNFIFNNNLV